MPADRTGVDLKIERAKKHLGELETVLDAFVESDPYTIVVEDNAQSGYREHKVVRAEPLPDSLPLICGDVVHNLRSALDHLIRQLIIANGSVNPDKVRSEFPIGKTKAAYEAARPGDTKGISKSAARILDGLKPYKGGNEALWAIHCLDIVDKHRLLLTVGVANTKLILKPAAMLRRNLVGKTDDPELAKMDAGLAEMKMRVPYNLAQDAQMPVVVGALLSSAPLGEDRLDDLDFGFSVTLDEPEIPRDQSIVQTLQKLIDATEAVVLKLGAEIR